MLTPGFSAGAEDGWQQEPKQAPSDVIGAALIARARDPNVITEASVVEAKTLLLGIRPSVGKIDSDTQIEDLAGGSACLMVI